MSEYTDGQIVNGHRYNASTNAWEAVVVPPVEKKSSKGKWIAGGVIAVLALALIGSVSGGGTSTPPTTGAPVAAAPAEAPALSGDEKFLLLVDGNLNVPQSDADLLNFGRTFCAAVSNGMTFQQYVSLVVQTGFDSYDAGVLAGAAVDSLCPENYDTVQSWFAAAS